MKVIERLGDRVRTRGVAGELNWKKAKRGTRDLAICYVCDELIPAGSLAWMPESTAPKWRGFRMCLSCGGK